MIRTQNDLDIIYNAPKTCGEFIASPSQIKMIVGPVGCFDSDTEFLSPIGWKKISEYNGEMVAQYDPQTEESDFVFPIEFIRVKAKRMIRFKTKYGIDMKLTPEHRVLFFSKKVEKYQVQNAIEISERYEKSSSGIDVSIPCSFVSSGNKGILLNEYELRVMVAVIADGWVRNKNTKMVCINIKKQRKKDRLEFLLNKCGIKYNKQEGDYAEGYTKYYFHAPRTDKEFNEFYWGCSKDQLQILSEEIKHWDSYIKKDSIVFSTTNKESADFVQYVYSGTRNRTRILMRENKEKKHIEYSVIVSFKARRFLTLGTKDTNTIWNEKSEDGYAYCFSVPKTFLVIRRNGCVFISGNSGKTTSGIMNILKVATDQMPAKDGVKRTRIIAIRNTEQQLRDTTMESFFYWFKPGVHGIWRKTAKEFIIDLPDAGINCEVWFRALDTPDDRRKLLSIEATGMFFDEIKEINPEIFQDSLARCGRYPSSKMGGARKLNGDPHRVVWGSTNPPTIGTYWANTFLEPPNNMQVFWQPSGLSKEAENIENLPKNYYQDLCYGRSENWIDVFVHGKLGQDLGGKPVYPGFTPEFHIAKEPLKPRHSVNYPIVIGMDFGLNPSAVIGQMNPKGQILIYDELCSDGMGVLRFIQKMLKPLLNQKFFDMGCHIFGDPSGINRSQTDERSVYDILKGEGLSAQPARTNDIILRISAVDGILSRHIDMEPSIIIDPGCKKLISGFRGAYKYKRSSGVDNFELPEKNEYSHIHDALQYLCLHFNYPVSIMNTKRQARRVEFVDSTGWSC